MKSDKTLENGNSNEEVEKKETKKKSKKKTRRVKKTKNKDSENKVKRKVKKKKRKINKLNVFLVITSTIFVCIAIFVSLVGTGVISFEKNTGPILYKLSEKVKVGDYVNYDAGKWDNDVIVPDRNNPFTFGGYSLDGSRNNGVTCNYNDTANDGWRVFSIEEENVTLIHAGISMCYYHGYGSDTNERSVSILNGLDESIKYDYFLDEKFGESVRILSREDIDKFYGEDASFKRIDDDLIKVGNPYWLATKNGSYYLWYVTEGGTIAVNHVGSYGVRVLVTLKEGTMTSGQTKDKIWKLIKETKKEE